MQKDAELISLCCTMVEKSLQWGESSHWTNQDFEALSEKILAKTHVNLSVSTLKRIWGKVKYDSTPTLATLNALAKYLDYESWRDFQVKNNRIPASTPESVEQNIAEPAVAVPQPRKQKYALVMMTSLVLVGVTIVLLLVKGKSVDYSLARFESHKASNELPNSVIFNYDASSFDADSVFIQQNWDPRRRERVAVNGKQHTSIYYRPGYFQAKLIVNNEIVREDTVFIQTLGWRGIVDGKPAPAYMLDHEMKQPGALGITSATMKEKTHLNVFNDVWTQFYNVRDFKVSGNDFDFQVTLRNTSLISESVCREINVTLLTVGSALVIPLGPKGCVSALDMLAPNGWVLGKENDMSKFGCEIGEFQTISVKNTNSTFRVELNGKEIYSEKVRFPVGDIVGIRLGFEGTGEIAAVKLGGAGKVSIDEDFRKPL